MPVTFEGQVLSECAKNYDAANHKLFTLYYAVKQNAKYLFQNELFVRTIHKAFSEIMKKHCHWIEYLEELYVKLNPDYYL